MLAFHFWQLHALPSFACQSFARASPRAHSLPQRATIEQHINVEILFLSFVLPRCGTSASHSSLLLLHVSDHTPSLHIRVEGTNAPPRVAHHRCSAIDWIEAVPYGAGWFGVRRIRLCAHHIHQPYHPPAPVLARSLARSLRYRQIRVLNEKFHKTVWAHIGARTILVEAGEWTPRA